MRTLRALKNILLKFTAVMCLSTFPISVFTLDLHPVRTGYMLLAASTWLVLFAWANI